MGALSGGGLSVSLLQQFVHATFQALYKQALLKSNALTTSSL